MTDQQEDWLGLVGTTLQEKYVVERLVAEGGFSVVYRATHAAWNQPVAVKVLTALVGQRADDHKKLLEEFFREGALLRELSSRTACILQAYDIATYEAPGGEAYPYLVLEWLEGKALDEVIYERQQNKLPPWTVEELVQDMEPLAKALGVVHRRGVSHRDIKPTNIFLVGYPKEKHVKLLDFGIAKVVNSVAELGAATAKTGGAISSFSPWYGAPEQFSRTYGATGPWTDVFAFALVLVEMLGLRDPLDGETIPAVALKSTNTEIRPTPRNLGIDVSDAVEAVFAKALAVDTTARFQTAGQMWSALREAIGRPEATRGELSALGDRGFLDSPTDSRNSFDGGRMSRPSFGAPEPSDPGRASFEAGRVSIEPVRPSLSVSSTRGSADAPAGDETAGSAPATPAAPMPALAAGNAPPSPKSPLAALGIVAGLVLAAGLAALFSLVFLGRDKRGSEIAATSGKATSAGASNGAAVVPSCPASMVLVPAGTFRMGMGETSDGPPHDVTLSAFCLDRTEVTADDYRACQKNGECPPAPRRVDAADIPDGDRDAFSALCTAHLPDTGRHPINCVDHGRAAQYCGAQKKRLPTSAEWERVARGPDNRAYPWGSGAPDQTRLNACGVECTDWGTAKKVKLTALFGASDGFATTAPVGSFPLGISAEGALDIQGNVMEWVGDWDGPMSETAETDPTGPTRGEKRVVRGGTFTTESPAWLRPAFRFALAPESKSHGIGFRCAQTSK